VTDAVADVVGLQRVDHPKYFQLDPRRQLVEKTTATTEQHRDLVDLQLVRHLGLRRPLCRVDALDHHVAVSHGGLRLRYDALDPVDPAQSHRLRPDSRSVDPVGQVRGEKAVGRLARDQPQVRAYAGEQGGTAAEDDRRDMQADLVD
jgi:hypothetical protein